MLKVSLVCAAALCTLTSQVAADDFHLTADDRHEAAPEALGHMAPLIGDWHIEWQSLDENGEVQASGEADWHWRWILDGHAVQDVWLNPSLSQEVERRFRGTNLRTFNSETGQWEMIWVTNQPPGGATHYTATSTPERIEMHPVEAPQSNRIIFYNMTGDHFDWVSEDSADGGESWTPTLRITGERVSD